MEPAANPKPLVAVDLGAQSCRVALLRWNRGEPEIALIHRFLNEPHSMGDELRWDIRTQCLEDLGIARLLPDLLAESASLSAPPALIDIDDPQWMLPGHTIDKINSQLVALGQPTFARNRASIPSLVTWAEQIVSGELIQANGSSNRS
jgi:hypothetical protein